MSVSVSIVIPVFNRAEALEPCLNALAQQSDTDFEIVIVDDGSTDNTAERVQQLQEQYRHMTIAYHALPGNRGANVARNVGVKRASGSLICFIDSDCLPEKEWLKTIVRHFVDDSVGLVTGCVEDTAASNIYEQVIQGMCQVYARNGYAVRIVSSNVCVRKELLLRYPLPEDVKYGCNEESLYLFLKAAGWRQLYDESACVTHHHPYTFESFKKRAYGLGCAAGWLVYKYYLPPRLDMLLFILLYVCVTLTVLNSAVWWGVFACAMLVCGALGYNEHVLKKKPLSMVVRIFPMVLVYYHLRLWGYVRETVRLHFLPNTVLRIDVKKVVGEHEER